MQIRSSWTTAELKNVYISEEKKEAKNAAKQTQVKNGPASVSHTSLFIAHRVTFSQRRHQPWNFPSIFCQETLAAVGTGGRQEQRERLMDYWKYRTTEIFVFFKKKRGFSGWLSVVRRTRKDVDKGHATGTRRLRREDASGWNNWTYWRPVHKAGRKTSRLCQNFQSELSRNKTVIVQQRAECDDSALIQILIVSMLVLVVYRYQRDRINTFCSLSSVWNPLNKLNK